MSPTTRVGPPPCYDRVVRRGLVLPWLTLVACATSPGGGDPPDSVDARRGDARVDAFIPGDPDACVATPQQLLQNGGFDDGSSPWVFVPSSSTIIAAPPALPFPPQAGGAAGWFGGANNTNDRVIQLFAVPAGAQALRVTGFECFVTTDSAGADDSFEALLRDASGNTVETLRTATNLDVGTTCAWTAFTWPAASSHAGESLSLVIQAVTDASFQTSFVLDSLGVEADVCP